MHRTSDLKAIYGERYYPDELYVFTSDVTGIWVDIVLEEWCEGITLKQFIEEAVNRGDHRSIAIIADRFDSLACDLLCRDWAHGDLSGENIIVTPELQLKLIDFDGKFIPEFKGRNSPELGTCAYQSTRRKESDFDSNIDDYSIALISTALRALSLDHTLLHQYPFADGLLLSPILIAEGRCEALAQCIALFSRHNLHSAYRVATLLNLDRVRIAPLTEIFTMKSIEANNSKELYFTMKHGFVGYTDSEDQVVIPHIYDDGLSFKEGIVMVRMGTTWCALDLNGGVVTSVEDCQNVKLLRDSVIKSRRERSKIM